MEAKMRSRVRVNKLRRLLYLLSSLIPFEVTANTYELHVSKIESSINSCYPKILNAVIQQELNQGKVQKGEAPFDFRLDADALQRQGSTYNTTYQKIAIEKRFYGSPISAYAGYDISGGYTPQYDSAQITSTLGRQFVGLKMNLLSGFTMDEERLNLYNSMLDKEKSDYELDLSKLLVKTEAIKAYMSWLVAGAELEAYQKLLHIAETRQSALEKRYKNGDLAEISIKENYNNVLKRKIKVASAKDYFNKASQYLSLYYRDQRCNIITPGENLLPKKMPEVNKIPQQPITDEVNNAVKNRPEFKIIQTQLQQIVNQQKLAGNYLLPKLNLSVQYNQNNSDTATSSYFQLNQQEAVGKLNFSLPLERSYGKGMDKETEASYRKLLNDRQLLLDQLKSQLETLHYSVDATASQVDMSKAENKLATDLLNAENRRIQNGDSNFFMLNLREDNAINSYLTYINVISSNYQALIEYNFLTGNNANLHKAYPQFN
ncbi:MAG: TolC family protein [Neisseriales bacterium]|nr:MAG: TolC family protein [Neisseriales bacterium]